jgi:hypothetical protein
MRIVKTNVNMMPGVYLIIVDRENRLNIAKVQKGHETLHKYQKYDTLIF